MKHSSSNQHGGQPIADPLQPPDEAVGGILAVEPLCRTPRPILDTRFIRCGWRVALWKTEMKHSSSNQHGGQPIADPLQPPDEAVGGLGGILAVEPLCRTPRPILDTRFIRCGWRVALWKTEMKHSSSNRHGGQPIADPLQPPDEAVGGILAVEPLCRTPRPILDTRFIRCGWRVALWKTEMKHSSSNQHGGQPIADPLQPPDEAVGGLGGILAVEPLCRTPRPILDTRFIRCGWRVALWKTEMKHSSSNRHGGQPIADPLQPPDEAVGGLGGILAVEPLCRTPRPILDTRFIRCGWRVALWKTEMKHSSSNRHGGQPIADPLQPPDEAVGGLGGILAVEPLCRTPRPILDTRFIRCGWRVALWKTEMKHSSSNRHGGQPIADPLQPPDEAVGGLGGILAVEPLCRTPHPILDTRFIRCGWRVALWKTEMKHSSSNQHGGQPIADPLQPPDEAVGGLGGILAVEPLCRTPRPILDTRFIRCGWRVALWKTEMKHSSSNRHGGHLIADPLQPPDEAVGGLGGILAVEPLCRTPRPILDTRFIRCGWRVALWKTEMKHSSSNQHGGQPIADPLQPPDEAVGGLGGILAVEPLCRTPRPILDTRFIRCGWRVALWKTEMKHSSSNRHGGQPIADPLQPPDEAVGGLGGILAVEPLCRTPRPILDTRFIRCGWRVALWKTEMKHSSSNRHGGQPIADPLQPPDEAVGGLGGILAVEPLCRTPRPILDTRFIRCGWRVALWKTEMKHSSSNRHGGQPIADPLQPPDEAVGGLGGILAVEPLCRTPRPILDTRFIRCGWRVALWKTEMKHSSSNQHGGQPIADPLQPPDEAVGGLGGILAVEPLCRTPRPILDTRFIRCGWRVALWKTEMKHSSSNQHGGQPIADPLQPPDEAVGGLGGILAVEPLCRTPRPILDTRFIRCGWRVALWKTEMKHSSSNRHGGQPIADPLQPPDEAVGGLGGILAVEPLCRTPRPILDTRFIRCGWRVALWKTEMKHSSSNRHGGQPIADPLQPPDEAVGGLGGILAVEPLCRTPHPILDTRFIRCGWRVALWKTEMKHSSSNQHGGQPIADPLQPPDEAVGGLGGILAVEPLCRTPHPILDTRFIRCGWRVALWKTEMKHSSSNQHGGQPIADPLQPPDEAVGGLGGILAVEPLCRTPRPILDTRFIRCGWRVALWKTEMKHSSSNQHGGQPIADPLQPPDEAVGGILAVEPLCRTPRPILDTRFIRCGWRVALWKTEMKHSSSNQHGGQPIADPLQPPDEAVGGLGGILAVEPLCRTPRPILDTRFIRCGWRVALWKTEMKHSSSNRHGGQPIADPLQPPDEAVGGLGGILAVEPLCRTPRPILDTRFIRCGWRVALWKTEMKHSSSNRHGGQPIADPLQPPDEAVGGLGGILAVEPLCRTPHPILDTRFIRCGWRVALWKTEMKHSSSNRHGGHLIADPLQPPDEAVGGLGGILAVEPLCRTPRPILDTRFIRCGWRVALWKTEMKHSSSNQHGGQPIADPLQPPDEAVGGLGGILAVEPLCRTPRPILDTRFIRCGWRVALWETEMKHSSSNQHGGQPIADPLQPPDEAVGGLGASWRSNLCAGRRVQYWTPVSSAAGGA